MTPPNTILRVNHGRRQLKCWEGALPTNNLALAQEWAVSSFRPADVKDFIESMQLGPVAVVGRVVIDGNVMPPLA